MTLPLTLTVTLGADKFEYHQVNAKVDKFTDEDNALLQFHVLPDYSVRVLISEYGRGRPENPMYPLYQSIEKDMDEYNQQHPLF